MQFTLGFYGDGDFFTMKGVVEEFFECIGMMKKVTYQPPKADAKDLLKEGSLLFRNQYSFLHPGRQATIIYDGKWSDIWGGTS